MGNWTVGQLCLKEIQPIIQQSINLDPLELHIKGQPIGLILKVNPDQFRVQIRLKDGVGNGGATTKRQLDFSIQPEKIKQINHTPSLQNHKTHFHWKVILCLLQAFNNHINRDFFCIRGFDLLIAVWV